MIHSNHAITLDERNYTKHIQKNEWLNWEVYLQRPKFSLRKCRVLKKEKAKRDIEFTEEMNK